MVNRVVALCAKHGLITAGMLLTGLATVFISSLIPGLSALLVAIAIGALLRNLRVIPGSFASRISWSAKVLLRAGIVLLGFKLSLTNLIGMGVPGIITLVVTVMATFTGTILIGRLLRVSRKERVLVATGFSICGASAVAAAASVIDPEGKDEEGTAQAIALVTIYGSIAMFVLPALVPVFGLTDTQAGIWIGASIHEVAQVVAAGGMVSVMVLATATVAKLGRIVLLAPLVATIGALERFRTSASTRKRPPLLPLFVAGFILAMLARTFVPMPDGLLGAFELTSNLLLTASMIGLGFGVDVRRLISTGWRPLILGAVSTVIAGATALLVVVISGA